jgi:hypothetical protein
MKRFGEWWLALAGWLILALVICGMSVLFTRSDKETFLVDEFISAQRAQEKAGARSLKAGDALTDYCQSIHKQMNVKPNGLVGCLPKPEPKQPDSDTPKK